VTSVMLGERSPWTVNVSALVAVLAPTMTEMVPVVAPEGTVTWSWVGVALDTVACVPSNFTMSLDGMVLNPEPWIVTGSPTWPDCGENWKTCSSPEAKRSMDVMLPSAS